MPKELRHMYRVWDIPNEVMGVVNCYDFDEDKVFYTVRGIKFSQVSGDFILLQCTGLRDRDGQPIYEGDIVEFNVVQPIWDDELGEMVDHRPETWRKVIKYIPPRFTTHWYPNKMRVVGNIYKNPKLIRE